jgi:predicted  nucleic acid-binding Zn ribbon protein
MLLAEYKFIPKPLVERYVLTDEMHGLLGALTKNGQLWGEQVFGWVNGTLVVTCGVPRSDALSAKHQSEWVQAALTRVKDLCNEPPTWRVLDDRVAEFDSFGSWTSASGLYLFTHAFDETSPIARADDGKPVPLYLLPVDQLIRQDLAFWMSQYRDLDRIWLNGGQLEVPAYRQLADPKSQFSKRGRRLARVVEEATGLPTYFYLMRYWGRRRREEMRRCPGCGGKWAVKSDLAPRGLAKHEFRCDPCRLISVVAPDNSEPERACIGEWRPK